MAENGVEGADCSPEEELFTIHKKERKELQAKIQTMKHAIPKGDKRKKKEVASEIALLEKQLEEKHSNELAQLKNNLEIKNVTNELNQVQIGASNGNGTEKIQRMSKAQKRRERKSNMEKDKEQRIAQEMLENINNPRNVEAQKLKEILKERDLAIFEIPSDGNCMYKAITHQLHIRELQVTIENLRRKTADYMIAHMDDFLPFLTSQKTGEMMTSEEFAVYCNEIAMTTAWGGQIELRAISHVYKLCIEVLQADGPSITIGDEYGPPSIILSYHRHEYGLGEHYNSIIPRAVLVNNEEDDEGEDAPS